MHKIKEGDKVCFKAWPGFELLVIEVDGSRITVLSIGDGTDENPGTFGILSTATVKAHLLVSYQE